MIMVAPSILSADFRILEKEIKSTEAAGADYLHLDIMDGHFVPNISFGPFIVDFCKKSAKIPLDVHLMIEHPELYIADFVKAGADIIVIHAEACVHLHRQIQLIKSYGIKVGVALNPATPIEVLNFVIEDLDLVLMMSVNPGYSGQKFIPAVLDKLRLFKQHFAGRLKEGFLLEVDGGVNDLTVKSLIDAGANMFVSGNYFFQHRDRAQAVKVLKGEV